MVGALGTQVLNWFGWIPCSLASYPTVFSSRSSSCTNYALNVGV